MAIVRVTHPDLTEFPSTALTAALAASGTTLTVENGLSFAASSYLVLEGYGSPKSELVLMSSSAGSATSITLNAGCSFGHTRGSRVQFIPYNQVAVEYSTDLETNWTSGAYSTLATASAASTWTALTTIDLDINNVVTIYNDTSTADRAYRTRFYNSTSTVYSNYSDPILPDGYEESAVAKILRKALNTVNQTMSQEDNGLLNKTFLLDELNNGLREVHSSRKRWSWNHVFDAAIGTLYSGIQSYILPTDIDITGSNKSLFRLWINEGQELSYIDKQTFQQYMRNVSHTTLAAELNIASTSIVLTDSSNFGDTGTFTIFTGTTEDTVSYTANNRSTNTLTLATTTGVTTTHASGTNVWEGASFSSSPYAYTVYNKKIHLYPIPNASLYLRDMEGDYYKALVEINSDNDYLIFPDPMILVYYVAWKISLRLRDANEAITYERLYKERLVLLQQLETTGQRNQFTLRLNTAGYGVNKHSQRIGRSANEYNL